MSTRRRRRAGGVATPDQNAKLKHVAGGSTTRDDALDAGVPMLPGDPSEPVGPEDALGEGPTRGDYRKRIVGEPHESVPVDGAGDPVTAKDDDGNEVIVDFEPNARLERQRPRADDIGDEKGAQGRRRQRRLGDRARVPSANVSQPAEPRSRRPRADAARRRDRDRRVRRTRSAPAPSAATTATASTATRRPSSRSPAAACRSEIPDRRRSSTTRR
jgi:hypothetical protein